VVHPKGSWEAEHLSYLLVIDRHRRLPSSDVLSCYK